MLGATHWAREVFADMGVYLSRSGTLLHNMLNIEMGERGRAIFHEASERMGVIKSRPGTLAESKKTKQKDIVLTSFSPLS
jgi:hypothetical protein